MAKWDPGDLKAILSGLLPIPDTLQPNQRLLVGFETNDDAAVYRLTDDMAAVLTVDFITPVVDDPYTFGRIAAANALSDIYAMGAKPLVALNMLALDSDLGTDVAREILRGGAAAVSEAGALVSGGHTLEDTEPKYGLSVFGTVHPNHIVRNSGAQPGDILYLSKPLGTGIMNSAYKVGRADQAAMDPVISSMTELNANASTAMLKAGVHAATDITGFGLLGHLHEMLEASNCSATLDWDHIPIFPGAWDLSLAYCRPSRTFDLIDFCKDFIDQGTLSDEDFDNRMAVLCDPQTSGGLLMSIPPESAEGLENRYRELAGRAVACIGQITGNSDGHVGYVGLIA